MCMVKAPKPQPVAAAPAQPKEPEPVSEMDVEEEAKRMQGKGRQGTIFTRGGLTSPNVAVKALTA